MSLSISASRPSRFVPGAILGLLTLAAVGFGLTRLDLIDPGAAGVRLLNILYGFWVAAVFVLLQVGIGAAAFRRIESKERTLPVSAPTRFVLAFSLGSYATYTLLLVLAVANALNLLTVGVYLLLACLAGVYALGPFLADNVRAYGVGSLFRLTVSPIGWRACPKETPDPFKASRTNWLWLAVIALWCIPYALQTTLPNTDWDGALFHLPFAEQIIEAGVLGTDPVFEANNSPAAMQLVYAVFLLVGAKTAILPFNFLVACGVLLVLYCLGTEFWDATLGRLAVLIGMTVNVLWEVAVTPRIDTFLAFYFVVGVLVFLLWRRGRAVENSSAECAEQASSDAPCVARKAPNLFAVIVGMMMGMTLGIKFTAVFFVLILVPLAIAAAVRDKLASRGSLVAPILIAATFAAIPSGFWYVRNAVQLGDPIYPFLTKRHVYRDTGGKRVALETKVAAMTAERPSEQQVHDELTGSSFAFASNEDVPDAPAPPSNLFNLVDALKRPTEYARKPLHTAGPFVLLFFALPLVARDRWSWLIFAIAFPLYLMIAGQTYLMRYLAPVLPLLAFGAALVAFRLNGKTKSDMKVASKTLAVLAVVFLGVVNVAEWKKLVKSEPLQYWSGNESEEEFVARAGYNTIRIFSRFMHDLNEEIRAGRVQRDAKLIMIGEGCGDLLLCDYKGDMSWNGRPWQVQLAKAHGDIDRVAENLKAEGYDHVLVNFSFLRYCHHQRFNDEQRQRLRWSLYHLNRFLTIHTDTVLDKYGIVLAKIKDDGPIRSALNRPQYKAEKTSCMPH